MLYFWFISEAKKQMQEQSIVIKWRNGLHARHAAEIVGISVKFSSKIKIKKNSSVAEANSLLSIMGLGAAYKTRICIIAEGEDESRAVKALVDLFSLPEEFTNYKDSRK
jgi:phosphocarrier protein HPr